MPKHDDVIDDIKAKLSNQPSQTQPLFGAIADVFGCKSVPHVLAAYPELLQVASGLPPQKLLLVLKWLFIEQDLAYWLYTGRDKLMDAIERSAFHLSLPTAIAALVRFAFITGWRIGAEVLPLEWSRVDFSGKALSGWLAGRRRTASLDVSPKQ